MVDFLFERNEQDEISNIYNHLGRAPNINNILRAVNCITKPWANYKYFQKSIAKWEKYDIIRKLKATRKED